tara:strand:+ start:468 stop:1115 length:648 start_codon:yes stop_codon:yes gene_type:complete
MQIQPNFHNYLQPESVGFLLQSSRVKRLSFYVLGPEGTNISQASIEYAKKFSLSEKSEFVFCSTPEESVVLAKREREKGVIPLFTTCAVYPKLHSIFFSDSSLMPFLTHHYMELDEMQLAAKTTNIIPGIDRKIASHPAPVPLLKHIQGKVLIANSNAHAATLCKEGTVDFCLTTDSARELNGLETIKRFGSPTMIFHVGTTKHGMQVLIDSLMS